ncbi:MAG: hypothetical protein OZ923_08145 [Comamonadaceae bacterium]|nr:hypothetical protein [Comamonadaceae bacterium]
MHSKPTAGSGAAPGRQAERLRSAIHVATAAAPEFLQHRMPAEDMAHTMVGAVRGYVEREQAAGRDGTPEDEEALHLQHALQELYACGSGYLAQRCDAA